MKLEGKAAIVTGGSRGIGAAIAERLAQDGADVAITYSKSPDAAEKLVAKIRATGRRAEAFKADGANSAEIECLLKRVVAKLGRLDILVNNAGVYEGGPVAEITDELYDRGMAVNVKAVFQTIREAANILPRGGRIVNVGSVLGERVPFPGLAVYSATKFAVAGLTRAAAQDLAPKGILVNCVQPGPINTDMNPENGPYAEGQKALVPLKRYGQPSEIAAVVSFLVGPDSTFVNGVALNVDGGFNA